jgi:hypothetical protein
LDELRNLLSQLGLGAAADPIYEMITDLDGENLTVRQLEQSIRQILRLHGFEPCADAVISALGEVGFGGLQPRHARDGHDGEAKAAANKRR